MDTMTVEDTTTTTDSTPESTVRRPFRHLKWAIPLVAVGAIAISVAVAADNGQSDGQPPDSVVEVGQSATFADLRFAAEWARQLEAVHPELFPPVGNRATYQDLMRAAYYADR